jgi:hypothetical protein
MARHDLRKMRLGMMDRGGTKQAESAEKWGIVGAALSLFSVVTFGLAYAWGIWPDRLDGFYTLALGALASFVGLIRLVANVIAIHLGRATRF